jgi:hypothetical protein
MATQTILFAAASGLTIPTVRLFSGTSDTIAATAAATERTNAKGIYAADYTDLAAGLYRVIALDANSTTLAVWWVRCAGGNSTAHATETPDATEWTQARAGYMDSMLQASNANQRTVQVTGSNHIAADVHANQPNVIDAAAIAADAVTEIQAGLATATTQTTILDRLGAFTGSGVNTVLGFLRALGSKAATTPSDMGGTYSAATDATEAIRDAMQAGTGDASQATLLAVQATVDAVAASLSGSAVEVVSRVADGGSLTLYAGDDMRVRSGTEVAVSVTDVGGAIYSRLNTIGTANLRFGAARPTQPAGAITGSVASLAVVGSGASQLVRVVIEIDDAGQSLAAADNYVWQLVSSRAQGSQYDTYTEIEGTLTVKRRVAVPVFS